MYIYIYIYIYIYFFFFFFFFFFNDILNTFLSKVVSASEIFLDVIKAMFQSVLDKRRGVLSFIRCHIIVNKMCFLPYAK